MDNSTKSPPRYIPLILIVGFVCVFILCASVDHIRFYFLLILLDGVPDIYIDRNAHLNQDKVYTIMSRPFQVSSYSNLSNATEEVTGLRNGLELVKSVSDKHLDLLRPSARYLSMYKGEDRDGAQKEKGKYMLIRDPEELGLYDKPLPCFGCGIGWFSFLLGFLFPLMWYYATILYFGNYYRKDPRERAGLAASAIAALACSVVALITLIILII